MELPAAAALEVGLPTGVVALPAFADVEAPWGLTSREAAACGLLLLVSEGWALGAPVHEPALITGTGRRVVGLPGLPRVLRLVDVFGVIGSRLGGRKKGVVHGRFHAVELCSQLVCSGLQKVIVDCAENNHRGGT